MRLDRLFVVLGALSFVVACEAESPPGEQPAGREGLAARIKDQSISGLDGGAPDSSVSPTISATVTTTTTQTKSATATYTVSATAIATNTANVYYFSWTKTGIATATANRTATASTTNVSVGTKTTVGTKTITNPYEGTQTKTVTGNVTVSGTVAGTPTKILTVTATSTNPTTGTRTHTYAGTASQTSTATGSNTGTGTQSWTYHLTETATQTATVPNLCYGTWAFCDNFETGNGSGWNVRQGPVQNFSVTADGTKVYSQSDSTASQLYLSQGGRAWMDSTVEASLKPTRFSTSTSAALITLWGHYDSTWGADCGYYVALRGDGKAALGKRVAGVDSALGSPVPVSGGIAAGTWYDVKLEFAGTTINAYVDGTLLLTQTDTSCDVGSVGVGSVGASFEADDVRVSAPSTNACVQDWRNTTCGAFCTYQAGVQSDRAGCGAYLDCYAAHGCSPATCGGQDDVCGVNVLNPWGTASKEVADQVYKCLGCTGSVNCANPRYYNGTVCADGDPCTWGDTCQNRVCVPDPNRNSRCDASDQCHDPGTCSPVTGLCSNPAKTEGTGCDDGNACTQTDLCQQGVCVGNDPVPCLALDPCHTRQCDQQTGLCGATELPEGTPCDDQNACTHSDACHTGICAGTAGSEGCDPANNSCEPPAVVCSQPSNPCLRSVCEPHSGSCITIPTDGKVCDDGDPDTQSDICVAGSCGGHHQPDGVCAAMPATDGSLRDDPTYTAAVQNGAVESQSYAFTASADPVANMNSTFVTIPVVFHVLDLNGTATVTDDEIRAELVRINQEFRNSFYSDLTGYAHSVAGNPRIQFALAQRTPTCSTTSGIERKDTTTTDFDVCNSDAIKFTAQGGLDAWTNANNPGNNPVNYLNVWISPIDRDPEGPNPRSCTAVTSGVIFGGLGAGTKDGIKSYPRAFRLKSAENPQPYRGISHEIGHWLGLYHTFETGTTATCGGGDETPGTGNCATQGDLICDTPACSLQRTCPDDNALDPPPPDPLYVANTCTDTPTDNADLFTNLMGYSGTRAIYHTCRNMFTADQSLRMQGTLLGSVTSRASTTPFASGMQSLLWSAGAIPPVLGPDIWMADSQADTGDEPNNASAILYDTDDIWNRETCDGLLEHQNPKYGSKNCLYVRIRNRGCSDYLGTTPKQLSLYWAKASTALSWPNPWTGKVNVKGTSVKMGDMLGSVALTTVIGAGQAIIANIEWNPPNPQDYSSFGGDKNHFCLLSRISGDGSPAKGETSDLASNVKKNRTIVWKNVEVTSDALDKRSYVTVGPAASGAVNLTFSELTGGNDVSLFHRWGTVRVDLGAGLYAKWVAGGKQGTNVTELSPGIVVLNEATATLGNLALAADDYFTLRLEFAPYPDNPQVQQRIPDVYRFDVSETSLAGQFIGGQRVTLKTYFPAGEDHHPPIP